MFIAKEQETLSEAQSGALHAPQHPFLQYEPFDNGISGNHLEQESED